MLDDGAKTDRRGFLRNLGSGALILGLAGQGVAFLRSLVPDVLYEPPRRFKVGTPESYPDGATFLAEHRVYVVRNGEHFSAISGVCTHLGCTVKLVGLAQAEEIIVRGKPLQQTYEFACPCHGSKFRADGTNYSGPAPKALAWHPVSVSPDDGQLVIDASTEAQVGTAVRV